MGGFHGQAFAVASRGLGAAAWYGFGRPDRIEIKVWFRAIKADLESFAFCGFAVCDERAASAWAT